MTVINEYVPSYIDTKRTPSNGDITNELIPNSEWLQDLGYVTTNSGKGGEEEFKGPLITSLSSPDLIALDGDYPKSFNNFSEETWGLNLVGLGYSVLDGVRSPGATLALIGEQRKYNIPTMANLMVKAHFYAKRGEDASSINPSSDKKETFNYNGLANIYNICSADREIATKEVQGNTIAHQTIDSEMASSGDKSKNIFTSIYVVTHGDGFCHGISPPATVPAYRPQEKIFELKSDKGHALSMATGAVWRWVMGFAVRRQTAVSRICNIDLNKVGTGSEKDLRLILNAAVSRATKTKAAGTKTVIYMNSAVKEALDKQGLKLYQASPFSTKSIDGTDIDVFRGYKIAVEENIKLTESYVPRITIS